MTTEVATDLELLQHLNEEYVRSVQDGDVDRFDQMLADDFLCTNSDGSLLNRAEFLEHTAHPVTISNLKPHDVRIRIFGDLALVHARTTFTMADGKPGSSRYTDIWQRRNGEWLAIAAQVTRY